MKNFKRILKSMGIGWVIGLCISVPVMAEDIEIYTQLSDSAATIKPNVLFILDNSGSMGRFVPRHDWQPRLKMPFDVTNSYPGGCYDATKIYYSTDGLQPACGSTKHFNFSDLHCDHANNKYNSSGSIIDTLGPIEKWGTYADQMAQHLSLIHI